MTSISDHLVDAIAKGACAQRILGFLSEPARTKAVEELWALERFDESKAIYRADARATVQALVAAGYSVSPNQATPAEGSLDLLAKQDATIGPWLAAALDDDSGQVGGEFKQAIGAWFEEVERVRALEYEPRPVVQAEPWITALSRIRQVHDQAVGPLLAGYVASEEGDADLKQAIKQWFTVLFEHTQRTTT